MEVASGHIEVASRKNFAAPSSPETVMRVVTSSTVWGHPQKFMRVPGWRLRPEGQWVLFEEVRVPARRVEHTLSDARSLVGKARAGSREQNSVPA
jgi:hypothetical protein